MAARLRFSRRAAIAAIATTFVVVSLLGLWVPRAVPPLHRELRADTSSTRSEFLDVVAHGAQGTSSPIHLACINDQPSSQPGDPCHGVLHRGLCFGETLFVCMEACGMCGVIRDVVSEVLEAGTGRSVPVVLTTQINCEDSKDSCASFAEQGQCIIQPDHGLLYCKAACGFCRTPDTSTGCIGRGVGLGCERGQAQGGGNNPLAPKQLPECEDLVDVCPFMAGQLRLCGEGPSQVWMRRVCKRSCGLCDQKQASGTVAPAGAQGQPAQVDQVVPVELLQAPEDGTRCADHHTECAAWRAKDVCRRNPTFMSTHCRRACGLCSAWSDQDAVWQVGRDAKGGWLFSGIKAAVVPPYTPNPHLSAQTRRGRCEDEKPACAAWANLGQCETDPVYMGQHCKRSCGTCTAVSSPDAPATVTYPPGQPPPKWAQNQTFDYTPNGLRTVRLNNGVVMPTIGFGTAGLGTDTKVLVEAALELGYRHLDSAQGRDWYREDLTGMAVRSQQEMSGVPRSEMFITTKIHPRHLGREPTLTAFTQSLVDFGTPYMDLTLLHYPQCWGNLCDPLPAWLATPDMNHLIAADVVARQTPTAQRSWMQSWRALEELYEANKTRAIGVSNFFAPELKALYDFARIKPQVVQVHMDPYDQAADVRDFCRQHGIQVVAYSSLGTQYRKFRFNPVLDNGLIQDLARLRHHSSAQVTLRWVLHMGALVIPRSSLISHMQEGLDVLEFSLPEDDIKRIFRLDGTLPTNVHMKL